MSNKVRQVMSEDVNGGKRRSHVCLFKEVVWRCFFQFCYVKNSEDLKLAEGNEIVEADSNIFKHHDKGELDSSHKLTCKSTALCWQNM